MVSFGVRISKLLGSNRNPTNSNPKLILTLLTQLIALSLTPTLTVPHQTRYWVWGCAFVETVACVLDDLLSRRNIYQY